MRHLFLLCALSACGTAGDIHVIDPWELSPSAALPAYLYVSCWSPEETLDAHVDCIARYPRAPERVTYDCTYTVPPGGGRVEPGRVCLPLSTSPEVRAGDVPYAVFVPEGRFAVGLVPARQGFYALRATFY